MVEILQNGLQLVSVLLIADPPDTSRPSRIANMTASTTPRDRIVGNLAIEISQGVR